MFIRHRFSLMALSLFWAFLLIDSTPILAQLGGRTGGRSGGRTGGTQFSQVTQLLNTALPTVNVFDAQGKPLSTASLRGCYTVLVFGCLT
jgi:cytochrome oxidase Cu insertion factor (SCO1/SenC/PrrC family)